MIDHQTLTVYIKRSKTILKTLKSKFTPLSFLQNVHIHVKNISNIFLTIRIKSYTKCYLQFNIKDVQGNNSISLMFVIFNLYTSYPVKF